MNGKSRENGSIVYTRHMTKTKKKHNKTKYTKLKRRVIPHQILRVKPDARERYKIPASYKAPAISIFHHYTKTNKININKT